MRPYYLRQRPTVAALVTTLAAGASLVAGAGLGTTLAQTSNATVRPAVDPAVTVPLPAKRLAATSNVLRSADWNIRNFSNDTNLHSGEKPWATRRGVVVQTIKDQAPDFITLQEAGKATLPGAVNARNHTTQFDDLVEHMGGSWKLTNDAHYNCLTNYSPNHCVYKYQGASGGNRIMYDSAKLILVEAGSKELDDNEYLAWAIFQQRSTGKRFITGSLHLSSDHSTQKTQAKQAVAWIKEKNTNKYPIILSGDFNSSRFEHPSNAPYDVMVDAGLKDPLGAFYRSTDTTKNMLAEKRIHTWLNSSNPDWQRKAPNHKEWKHGSYIDYMFITKMRVPEWETVANLDSDGNIQGVIPSDHQMIRADLILP